MYKIKFSFFILVFLSLILLSNVSLVLAQTEYPDMKVGLWETNTKSQGQPDTITQTCIDKNTISDIFNLSQKMLGGSCNFKIAKQGNGYSSESTCDTGIMKIYSKSFSQGDFSSQFTTTTDTKMEPDLTGTGLSRNTAAAKYIGECPAGMAGGDVKMPDGKIMNPKKMMEGMPKDFMKNMGDMMKNLPQGQGN